jgi:hypothetical protein
MSTENDLIREISIENETLRINLDKIRKKSLHSNIVMIVDYFYENLEEMHNNLILKKSSKKMKDLPDIKMYEHKKLGAPDPESLQSVLQYILNMFGDEFEVIKGELIKSKTEKEYLENYLENIGNLRKKSEHLYHDLVEIP